MPTCQECDGSGIVEVGQQTKITALKAEIARLREVCYESNAVCVCGCPEADHEQYDDEGESCEDETHECIRTSRAVAAIAAKLRAENERLKALIPNLPCCPDGFMDEPCTRLQDAEARVEELEAAWLTVCNEGNVPQYEEADEASGAGILHGIRQLASMWSGEQMLRKQVEAGEKELRAEIEWGKTNYVPPRNVLEMLTRLERSGYGKLGTPNTLWAMVMQICDDVDALKKDEARVKELEGE